MRALRPGAAVDGGGDVRGRWTIVAAGLAATGLLLLAVVAAGPLLRGETATTPEPPPEPTEGSEPAVLESFRLGAPEDCGTNPFCLDGLARTYGIDVTEVLVPLEPGEPVVAALRGGTVEVGVLFTTDPLLASEDLVVLEDDRGMLAAENVVPYARAELVEERGAGLRAAIDRVSEELTTATVSDLVAEIRAGVATDAAAAQRVSALDLATVEVADGDPVRIGAKSFDEDRVIAHVYAAGLRAQGVEAEVVELDGFRALEVASLLDREIDVAIDYAGSLLEFLDGFSSLASPDTDETVRALADLVAVAGYEVFAPAPATSANAFVVTAETAERYGVVSLSDLIDAAPAAEPTPPPGERPEVDQPLVLIGDDALGLGDTGPAVLALQELLQAAGYPPGPLNGIYEEPTRRAVAAFQTDTGLPPDGIAGPQTLAALEAAIAAAEEAGTAPPEGTAPPDPTPGQPAPDGAVIHLTFDDGPNGSYTPQILDLLARYDARAVFFTIGQQVGGGSALVQRAVAEGHRIGNHSWSHPSLAGLSRPAFDQEIGRTQDAIEAATGTRPSCLRPPYGAMSDQTRAWAAEAGLVTVLWDIDPQDWARPGVDAIVGSVVDYARPGDVVLFHDGGGNRDQTIAALERILPQLADRGFAFTIAPGC